MKAFLFLIEKEFKQILRNRIILAMIVALPTIQLSVLPYASTYEIKHVSIAVVDLDKSSFSSELIQKIDASTYLSVKKITSSYQQALEEIESTRVNVILEIPSKFEKDLRTNGCANIHVSADAVDGTMGSIGSSYLIQILQNFSSDLAINGKIPLQVSPDSPTMINAGINIVPQYRYNELLDYKSYMVPGILVMLLTLVGGILAALNIVSEKEQGTLEQINVSPAPKQAYILAKIIPFWIIGLVMLAIGFVIARLLYNIIPAGNLWTLFLFSTVYTIAFTGFGILISTSAKTQQQSMFIAFFFLLIFFLMGGLFTPISSMPYWAQVVTWFNPTAYLIDVIRLIVLKGSSFSDLMPQFFIISAFAVIFNIWAILIYDKTS